MLTDAPVRATIAVRDKETAKRFFGEGLGLKLVDENPVGMSFECGQGTFLEVYPTEFAGTAKNTVAGFQVDDLEATMDSLRSRGIKFEEYDLPDLKTDNGIAQLGPNRGSWFKDPDGNTFALVELARP